MTIARTVDAQGDFRFLLPAIPTTIAVVGALGLARFAGSGVDLVDPTDAEVVAATATDAARAIATGAAVLLLFGRGGAAACGPPATTRRGGSGSASREPPTAT